jgi:hypothetical protein
MKTREQAIETLIELYERLIAMPALKKGLEWKGEWPEWERGKTWHPEACGVYVLWETQDDRTDGRAPVYVGEGRLGDRVGASFRARPSWQYAQIFVDPLISGNDKESCFWRKALERFCILVLEPKENLE